MTLINTTTRNAFWRISRKGSTVYVMWGRIGTRGQTRQIRFANETSARTFVETRIDSKIEDRDYVPVSR